MATARVAFWVPSGADAKLSVVLRVVPKIIQFGSPMLSGESSRFPDGTALDFGVTSSVAVRAVPLMVADSVTVVLAVTVEVLTGKLALVAPAGT